MSESTIQGMERAQWPHVTLSGPVETIPSRASSNYSRASHIAGANHEADYASCDKKCDPLPMLHDLDHRIAQMGGSTMGLEISAVRIQKAKREPPLSPEQRRRELLWHQHESRFYERCGGIFHELQTAVESISQDIILLFYDESDPAGNPHFARYLVKLRMALDGANAERADAENEYQTFWAKRPTSIWV